MYIGLMRNLKNPSHLSNTIAVLANGYGIKLIYMRPKDINIEKGTVDGKILLGNKWHGIKTKIPSFIDISSFCFKKRNMGVIRYLRNKTRLSETGLNRVNKNKLQKILNEDNDFKYLVIPTKVIERFEDIMEFIDDFKTIVIKPLGGQFGRRVFSVEKTTERYKLLYKDTEEVLSIDELKSFYMDEIASGKFIVQKYIHSKTLNNHPFDCRINVEKGGTGEWEIARIYMRVGIGQKVVSNLGQGGIVSDSKSFLKANYKDNWQDIYSSLIKVAHTLPKRIEELRKSELMTLGIDIGIDRDGSIYLFEVNSAPGTTNLRAQAAIRRVEYYKYKLSV